MSSELACLTLRLVGPMQAWGHESQYSRRNTGLFPTKSALAGMICAAMGADRGSSQESEILDALRTTRLLVIALPRMSKSESTPLVKRRITDYHTVQNTITAEGKAKDTHLTYRQYLNDASFVAILNGKREFLGEAAEALDNPTWGLWLGRKSCVPAEPVLVRPEPDSTAFLFDTEESALTVVLDGRPLRQFAHQREVEEFEEGGDTLMDQPLGFESTRRKFMPRRVITREPGEGEP